MNICLQTIIACVIVWTVIFSNLSRKYCYDKTIILIQLLRTASAKDFNKDSYISKIT